MPVAFRATVNTTQSFGVTTFDDLALQVSDFDTDSGINLASNSYTVPAAANGKYMRFYAGCRLSAQEYGLIRILRNTGAGYSEIGRNAYDGTPSVTASMMMSTRPIQVSTGDQIKCQVLVVGGGGSQNSQRNYLSGHTIETFNGFIASMATKQLFTSAVQDTVTYDNLIVDTSGGWDTVGDEVFTVPAAYDGATMCFSSGAYVDTSNESADIKIERSTDGGSTWLPIAGQRMEAFNLFIGYSLDAGPLVVSSGDKFRVRYETGLSHELRNVEQTHFAGWTV